MKLMRIARVVLLLGTFTAAPASARAQFADCGSNCRNCSIGGKEGYDYKPDGLYDMGCYMFIPNCVSCVVSRANNGEDAEALLQSLRAASDRQVREIVRKNPGRLLLSPSRNLVVLLGTRCDPNALASVVYVSAARAGLLGTMGLRPLDRYLEESASK